MGPTSRRHLATPVRALMAAWFGSGAIQCRRELKLQERLLFVRLSQCLLYTTCLELGPEQPSLETRLRMAQYYLHCQWQALGNGNELT
jgi:hypothetical protein